MEKSHAMEEAAINYISICHVGAVWGWFMNVLATYRSINVSKHECGFEQREN